MSFGDFRGLSWLEVARRLRGAHDTIMARYSKKKLLCDIIIQEDIILTFKKSRKN